MSIHTIKDEFQGLIAAYDEGEITQEGFAEALEKLEESKVAKCSNAIKYLNMLSETIEGAKAEKKRIDGYVKALENRRKGIEQAFIYALKQMGDKEVLTNVGLMKIKKNPPAVVIDDIAKIPTQYQKQKIEVTIDKTAIKKAIQSGEKVDGAHIEQGEKLVY